MQIERVALDGVTLVGQPVHLFKTEGKLGTLADAVTLVEQSNTLAIEDAAQAAAVSLRTRIGKLKELGNAMAVMSAVQAYLAGEDSVSDTYVTNELQIVGRVAKKYNLELDLDGSESTGWSVTKGDATSTVAKLQQAINSENNEITRASQTVQNFLGAKRLAFNREEGIVLKYVQSSNNLVRNVG